MKYLPRPRQLPLVSELTAQTLRELGWVENRDFWITPDLELTPNDE
jgi:hypothetical protein